MAQKVSRYFGYYCRKICQQDLSKIAQSGHTGRRHLLLLLNQFDKDKWAPRVVLETFSPLGTYLPMLACCCFCSHITYSVFFYTLFISFLFPICIQCFSTSPLLSLSLSLFFFVNVCSAAADNNRVQSNATLNMCRRLLKQILNYAVGELL